MSFKMFKKRMIALGLGMFVLMGNLSDTAMAAELIDSTEATELVMTEAQGTESSQSTEASQTSEVPQVVYPSVTAPTFSEQAFIIAAGCQKQLTAPAALSYSPSSGTVAGDTVTIEPVCSWTAVSTGSSAGSSVLTVTETGNVLADYAGTATVYVSYSYSYQGQVVSSGSGSVDVTVTNPMIDSDRISLNIYGLTKAKTGYYTTGAYFTFTGLNSSSTVTATSVKAITTGADGSTVKTDTTALTLTQKSSKVYIYTTGVGDYEITLNADGKEFTCQVYVLKAYFTRNSNTICDSNSKTWVSGHSMLALTKGKTVTLKVKGFPSGEAMVWSSSNESVATVTGDGLVTTVATGQAVISVTCKGLTITYAVGVVGASAIKALKYAYKNYKTAYSQPKRMQKGYYDCSSFVWFSYKSAGFYIGNKYYAPTAAAQAYWCVKNHYMIYSGTVDVNKLLPGDLIYWTGANNGRYKGIYHVDIYTGNSTRLTNAGKERYLGTTIKNCMVARIYGTTGSSLSLKTASSSSKKKINIGWASCYGATGYQIYRSTSKKGKYKKIKTVKNTLTYTDSKVTKGKRYYYKVRPYYTAHGKTYVGRFSSIMSSKCK